MKSLFYRLVAISLISVGSSPIRAVSVTINAKEPQYRFEGWGTSICWWGNIIGGYSAKTRDTIVDLLFDTSNGLGLNIIRYNIGGGDAPSHNHMGAGKEMEGFKAGATADYDWTKDKNQRWVVQAARERIVPEHFIAEAFSNSPPYWMTVSGCASGASNSAENLKSGSYTDFADYLTEVVKHFHDEWGVTFATLEPLNEPMGDWWNVNGGQEGCSFSRTNQAKLIKAVQAKLEEKGLSTKISAPDEASYNETVSSYNSYDTETRSCISQINTHGYSGSQRADLRRLAVRDGKKLWASEIDGSGAAAPFDKWKHDHGDIVPGLDIANRIIADLRDLRPDGWVFWQAVESEQAQINLDKNWGCIHTDFTGGEKFTVCKKFHAFRQFTRFIRPGSRMIDCSSNDAIAAVSPDNTRLIIVQRNAGNSTVSHEYRISGFTETGTVAAVYRTSSSENFARLKDVSLTNGTLSDSAEVQSITTYCIDVTYGSVATGELQKEVKGAATGRRVYLTRSASGITLIENTSRLPLGIELFTPQGRTLWKGRVAPGVHPVAGIPKTPTVILARIQVSGNNPELLTALIR